MNLAVPRPATAQLTKNLWDDYLEDFGRCVGIHASLVAFHECNSQQIVLLRSPASNEVFYCLQSQETPKKVWMSEVSLLVIILLLIEDDCGFNRIVEKTRSISITNSQY